MLAPVGAVGALVCLVLACDVGSDGAPLGNGADAHADSPESPALDASSPTPDASAYQACFDDAGSLLTPLRECATANDCIVAYTHGCCGGGTEFGLNRASLPTWSTCENNIGACGNLGCAGSWALVDGMTIMNPFSTDDGKVLGPGDTAKLECTRIDGGPRICRTYAQADTED